MKVLVSLFIVTSLALFACSQSTPGTGSCTTDVDCPEGERCQAGVCYADCSLSSDCPAGRVCVSGVCRVECQTDQDCVGLERCINGYCMPEEQEQDGSSIPDAWDGGGDLSPDAGDQQAPDGGDQAQADGGADPGGDEGECQIDSDCPGLQVCESGLCICLPGNWCGQGGECCPGVLECVDSVCRPHCDGTRCGHRLEMCCVAGQLCEDERCLIDCGINQRCGLQLEVCCTAGEICYGSICTVPQGECISQSDCPEGYTCDLDLGVCLEIDAIGNCEYHPPVGVFEPAVEWEWTQSPVEPGFNQIMMAPVVASLTDDNLDGVVDHFDVPDVVFSSFTGSAYNARGVLRIVSGDDGSEHVNVTDYNVHPGSCPAVADLDMDGVPEIVVDKQLGPDREITGTYAFHADGTLYWEVPDTGCATGGPAIADLDGNGFPEVITRTQIISHDGNTICSMASRAGLPVAADLDLDGNLEAFNGTGYRPVALATGLCESMLNLPTTGNPAIADFDADPYPEIVFRAAGQLHLVNHDGITEWAVDIPLDMPRIEAIYGITDCTNNSHKACNTGGGPPTIADFDGDNEPEIGLAARWYYLVYESNGDVLWAHKTQDYSSANTGSSVFDFEGDGAAEVVYNDELYLRVYKGSGGGVDADGDGFNDAEILIEIPNPSGTLLEYPLVVDVDADGRSEIVLMANNYAFSGFTGLRVFGDALDNWVSTRRVWNQHSYHVTNICDGIDPACLSGDNVYGAAPAEERNNWEQDWLNNYRQNVQGVGLFWAPDLVVSNLHAVCEADLSIYITFDVRNVGSRMVPAGVAVSVYLAGSDLIETMRTTEALLPGQLEHFNTSWTPPAHLQDTPFGIQVTADDVGDGTGEFRECEDGGEDNNSSLLDGIFCAPA